MPPGPDRHLDALPHIIGGKRLIAPRIFRALREAGVPPARGHVLLDPFMGGGSVSMYGKLLGYRVIANDTSARSEAVGRALIQNGRVQLDQEDVALALAADPEGWYLPALKLLPWPEETRRLLASIAKTADAYEGYKRDLLRAFMVKFAHSISLYGLPRQAVHTRIRDRAWDQLTNAQAKRIHLQTEPRRMALAAARAMHGNVFQNGEANEMHRGDALDFLAGRDADAVYLDPPYPGTVGYEKNYVGIDAVLENRELPVVESRFSASDGWRFIGEVLDAAERVPVWVLSLGNEAVGLSELEEMMRERGRDVRADSFAYKHLPSRATEEKSAANLEYLLVGTKARATA